MFVSLRSVYDGSTEGINLDQIARVSCEPRPETAKYGGQLVLRLEIVGAGSGTYVAISSTGEEDASANSSRTVVSNFVGFANFRQRNRDKKDS